MKKLMLCAALLTAHCSPLFAIELSLEENKGEKGTVGFVDMDRLFREYPETKKAKESFEADVQAKRVELKRRRAAISDSKSELADLQVEREHALREGLTEPAVVPQAPAQPPAPVLPTPVSTGTVAAPDTSTRTVA